MIEQLLTELKASLDENTAALKQVIALSGTAPVAAAAAHAAKETPAPKAAKETKAKAEKPAATPAPDLGDEPAAETPANEPQSATFASKEEAIVAITNHVKGAFQAAGNNLAAKKDQYEKIRAGFGVAKATELTDDQIAPFWEAIQAL